MYLCLDSFEVFGKLLQILNVNYYRSLLYSAIYTSLKVKEDIMKLAKEQMTELNTKYLHPKATKHRVNKDSDKRLLHQHDRDRIVWSQAFKRLAYKTQIFPQQYSDHHRRRLTHSLEVMQLSTSIARTLRLNDTLCEAIALGHDLGHTPFGHAGEEALNEAITNIQITCESDYKGLKDYTHYEQGLDVASYINPMAVFEKNNSSNNGKESQKWLSIETREGILKHMYKYKGNMTERPCLKYLLAKTKYSDQFNDSFGSPEAQTVRLCDKISYLISDIEDGLSIDAIHLEDIMTYEPFKKALETEDPVNFANDEYVFSIIRSEVITDLIENVLDESSKRLDADPKEGEALISFDNTMEENVEKIFKEIQQKILFNNFMVVKANQRAKHIVSCLFCQYIRHPEIIPWKFRSKYAQESKRYRDIVNSVYIKNPVKDQKGISAPAKVKLSSWLHQHNKDLHGLNTSCEGAVKQESNIHLFDIICAKDYVAGMTDNYAEECFAKDIHCRDSIKIWDSNRW